MSDFEYFEDEVAEIPSYNLNDYRYLSLFGFTNMRVPFKAVRGNSDVPGFGFQGDEKTGLYSAEIGQLGISLAGLPGALFLHELDRITLRLKSRYRDGDLYHENTLDRSWKLPDRSGIIALEESFIKTNSEAFSLHPGQPIKLSGSSGVELADASDIANQTIGVSEKLTASGEEVFIKTFGLVETEDWTDVIGTTNLTVGVDYFLSSTAGKLTSNPTDSTGRIFQYVGKAVTATELLINIARPIIL